MARSGGHNSHPPPLPNEVRRHNLSLLWLMQERVSAKPWWDVDLVQLRFDGHELRTLVYEGLGVCEVHIGTVLQCNLWLAPFVLLLETKA